MRKVVRFKMDQDDLCPDLISELPESIIETILIKLPIKEAVRTCILSSKWRYKWSFIPELVFDKECIGEVDHESVVNIISKVLFLDHQGPVHKFHIADSSLHDCPEIEQWILFLSRKNIKDLILNVEEVEEGGFRIPPCIFSCQKLYRLNLSFCLFELPPHSYRIFSSLKCLSLYRVVINREAIERLISCCPVLEILSLEECSCRCFTICAPNLKFLILEGYIEDICLVDMPLLIRISFLMDFYPGHIEQTSKSNLVKFLGGVPNLKRLVDFSGLTKYLSIGMNGLEHLAIKYNNLKTIDVCEVNFDDMKEIFVVLSLIKSSPNLEVLKISGSSNTPTIANVVGSKFWEEECGSVILSKLKVVKMRHMCCAPNEIQFIKYLLRYSPVLEKMSIHCKKIEGLFCQIDPMSLFSFHN